MLKLFSVDDHIVEPADVWSKRVPARYKDRAPHVVERDGRQTWEWEGGSEQTMGLNAVAGKPREQWGMEPTRFEDMIPGCYDPKERARDFLSQGIFASLAFPTLPGFGGPKIRDSRRQRPCLCVCPGVERLHIRRVVRGRARDVRTHDHRTGMGRRPLCGRDDPDNSSVAPRHCAGSRTLPILDCRATTRTTGSPCSHCARRQSFRSACTSGEPVRKFLLRASFRWSELPSAFTMAAESAVNLMCSHLPRKYPDVKLVWSEGGIGWITAALERADRQWDRHRYWTHVPDADILPSEVARKNMWFCMIEEPIGIRYRYDYTVDHILWESDYPHADTPFPNTQASVKEQFETVPADEVAMMTYMNAESLFKFPLSDAVINRYTGG